MRRLFLVILLLAVSAGLAGCGSSSSNEPATDVAQPSAAGTTGDTPSEEPTPDFPTATDLAGTFSISGNGARLLTTWSVGQPAAGTPSGGIPAGIPADAVAACNADSTVGIATSVYVPVILEISYAKGSIATQLSLNRAAVNDNVFSSSSTETAYDVDGQWDCNNPPMILHPGDTKTVHALVIAQILGNQHPTFTEDDQMRITAARPIFDLDVGPQAVATTSGPGAVCPATDSSSAVLFLFRRDAANLDCSAVGQ